MGRLARISVGLRVGCAAGRIVQKKTLMKGEFELQSAVVLVDEAAVELLLEQAAGGDPHARIFEFLIHPFSTDAFKFHIRVPVLSFISP
eukprot:1419360-Rhodomonas_salina.1